MDGDVEGLVDGDELGDVDGDVDGEDEGLFDGTDVDGDTLGDVDGDDEGDVLGDVDGDALGLDEGEVEGLADGDLEGRVVEGDLPHINHLSKKILNSSFHGIQQIQKSPINAKIAARTRGRYNRKEIPVSQMWIRVLLKKSKHVLCM